MPSNCSVFGCSNTKQKTKDSGVKYFRFPKDELIKQWKNACRRADSINHKNAVICSDHFAVNDYVDDMKSRLLNCEISSNKRTLKNDAVPSLHLPNGVLITSSSIAREGRVKKRNDRRIVQELCQMINGDSGDLTTTDIAVEPAIECPGNTANESLISEVTSAVIPEEIKRELQQLRDEVKRLKEENILLRKENT
ncbi:THAP domain-containing protein 1-like [Palaemon carinicauda]|uniref:THAP domain-containing protein 1-like n=1 Tax=Palaemon carinicauda TaxID=392227 RepID=UPI0035B61E83